MCNPVAGQYLPGASVGVQQEPQMVLDDLISAERRKAALGRTSARGALPHTRPVRLRLAVRTCVSGKAFLEVCCFSRVVCGQYSAELGEHLHHSSRAEVSAEDFKSVVSGA